MTFLVVVTTPTLSTFPTDCWSSVLVNLTEKNVYTFIWVSHPGWCHPGWIGPPPSDAIGSITPSVVRR